ncbi:MAG: ROK family glucokinase [Lachnospiraceae bacterium]|nr:ROK family glucokinase [Lachnospiraceae bacterium]
MAAYLVGVDVGGTTTKIGIFPQGERAIAAWEIPTRKFEEIDYIWEDIASAIFAKAEELKIGKEELKAVGVGLPGPIRDDGFLPRCVNLGMGACHPADLLSKALGGIPVAAGNDANVAALGEVYYGAAKGYQDAVVFTLGTGVGGGIILKGRIVAGNRGLGGEVGHMVVNPDEEAVCNCGNRGCLEQYASATGIVRIAHKFLKETDKASSLRGLEDFSCKTVCDEAKAGDELALDTLEVFGKYLGIAVAHTVLTVDPDIIILGGGVTRAGQILIDVTEKYMKEFTHLTNEHVPIVIATLGNDAGIYGSAALAASLLDQ